MKSILLIIFSVITLIAYTQKPEGDDLQLGLPDFTPISPNAASLGNFGNIPVGLNTGTPNINIPLYTINIGDFNFPISLNYSSNGIKVDQRESVVGLGWSISNLCVISRQQRHNVDETPFASKRYMLPDADLHSDEMHDHIFNLIENEAYHSTKDFQPDLFSYNLNGISGTFYLDNNEQPVLLSPDAVEIEKLIGFNQGISITDNAFRLVNGNGVQYIFKTAEIGNYKTNIQGPPTSQGVTSWYINKIILASEDTLRFNYVANTTRYIASFSQNISAKYFNYTLEGIPSHVDPVYTKVFNEGRLLSSIEWKSGEIQFSYSELYDGVGNTDLMRIDSIIIENRNSPVKRIVLNYQIFDALGSYKNNDIGSDDESADVRDFLISVFFEGNNNDEQKYVFDYYSPDEMAPRLSYSQDDWGYFNGKDNADLVPKDLERVYDFLQRPPGDVVSMPITLQELDHIFRNVGGDKTPDFSYGIRGLLKSVQYPTNGKTSLIYEPHLIRDSKYILSDSIPTYGYVNVRSVGMGSTIESFTTDTIPFAQGPLKLHCSVAKDTCWEGPDHWVKMDLKILDLTTGELAPIIRIRYDGMYIYESNPVTITENSTYEYYTFLAEGHVYIFELKLIKPCLYGSMNIRYYDVSNGGYTTMINKQVGGGRIRKVISDNSFGKQQSINYYYGHIDSLNASSGKTDPIKSIFSTHEHISANGSMDSRVTVNLSSSSLYTSYALNGSHIQYEYVTEVKGDTLERYGLTLHKYEIGKPNYQFWIAHGEAVPGTPFGNDFGNGFELEKSNYKIVNSQYKIIDRTFSNYENSSLNKSTSYGISSSVYQENEPGALYISNINVYDINQKWRYLSSQDRYEYNPSNGNIIKSIHTDFEYGNPEHFQLTKKTTTTSRGRTKELKYLYPKDYNSSVENYTVLNENNIVNKPVKSTMLIDNKIANSTIAKYNDQGKVTEILNYENTSLINEPIHDPNLLNDLPNQYNSKLTAEYDASSNTVKQIQYENKPSVCILWGYNYSYVIASIENTTFNEVIGQLPCSYSQLQEKSNAELNVIFANLRNTNPNYNITNYIYKPLIGMISKTDINGNRLEYSYDDLNRLKLIEDVSNDWIRILKKLEYHYIEN